MLCDEGRRKELEVNTGCHAGFLEVDLVLVIQAVISKTTSHFSEFSRISLAELSCIEQFSLD